MQTNRKKIEKYSTITPTSSSVFDALMKKALGFELREVVEEYSLEGGEKKELTLIKKKVNTILFILFSAKLKRF